LWYCNNGQCKYYVHDNIGTTKRPHKHPH
jgi:hypothetical protein